MDNPNHHEYIKALHSPGGKVLGLSLGPLTIGHVDVLEYVGSPFMSNDGAFSPTDLFTAVAILSRSPQAAAQLVDDVGRNPLKKRNASRVVSIFHRARCFTQKGFERAAGQFKDYLSANWNPPKMRWKRKGDTDDAVSAIPYTEHLRAMLCEMNRADPDTVDQFPADLAIHIVEGRNIRDGGKTSIETPGDRKMDEFFKKQKERIGS